MVNAGINRAAPALEVSETDWDGVMAVNLRGAFFCAQPAARHMVTAGGGSIAFTSSQLADFPRRRMPAYIASKAGLLGLTRALALEWGPHRVRVNAIQPGVIATPLTAARRTIPREVETDLARIALGRLGEPEDLVGMAVFLASDESAYVTGACFRVDGGWLGP
jgi:2-deoxy-D-gluconate 3-dehydrogenase